MYLMSKRLNILLGAKQMDIKYKRQLLEVGMDLNSVLDRFMNNEGLYERFLVKFLEDSNFFELMKNIEAGNYEEAFFNAHTLKGVSANLGLTSIHNPLVSIVDELRDNKINDSSEVKNITSELQGVM
jgi:HPt (histidine-containing phosphotransfer) domain-containing protein